MEFVALIGGVAAGWPLAARVQQAAKVPRVGILSPAASEAAAAPDFNASLLTGAHVRS